MEQERDKIKLSENIEKDEHGFLKCPNKAFFKGTSNPFSTSGFEILDVPLPFEYKPLIERINPSLYYYANRNYELILNEKLNRATFLEVYRNGTKKATRVQTRDEDFVNWELSYLLVKAKFHMGNAEFKKLINYLWKRFKSPNKNMLLYLEGLVGQYDGFFETTELLKTIKLINNIKKIDDEDIIIETKFNHYQVRILVKRK